jgi:hypothetical protein
VNTVPGEGHTGFLEGTCVGPAPGSYGEIAGPAKHYRAGTEDDVVDIIAFAPPSLDILPQTPEP